MRTQTHGSARYAQATRPGWGWVFMLWLGAASAAFAASPCPLGLRSGAAITQVDGVRDGEWGDATVTASGSPCLARLRDEGGSMRDVTVYSKRFGGGELLPVQYGFFFEVQDHSSSAASGLLPNGERIILQFDSNFSDGGQLENGASARQKDHKIEIVHKWQNAPAPADIHVVTNAVLKLYDGSGLSSAFCPPAGRPVWNDVTASVAAAARPRVAIRKDLPGGGYTVEVVVSEEFLGDDLGDIGIAFGIINDFGTCAQPGVCDGFGLSFPGGLPFTNADNPVAGCGNSWIQPSAWATGYGDELPGDVYISSNPVKWLSEDVDGLACGAVSNDYFPGKPCRLSVRATLRSSSTVAQTRNVLYVRGDHGTGPVAWKVVDLKEGVSVPAMSTTSFFDSGEAPNADVVGLTGHPCVRAYVMPPGFRADFPKSQILAITTSAGLEAMEAAYGIQDQHWAQQNISRQTAGAECPNAACRIGLMDFGAGWRFASGSDGFLDASLYLEGWPDRLSPVASAQAETAGGLHGGGESPPVVQNPGKQILLPADEQQRYGKDHVIVQVTAVGYRDGPDTTTPRYNFLETIGGIVQVLPKEQFAEGKAVPIRFQVGNPAEVPRTIRLDVDLQTPTGLEGVKLALDTSPKTFGPNETRLQAGTAGPGAGDGQPPGPPPLWLIILLVLAILIILLIWWLKGRS